MPDSIPVIFIHSGNSDYLRYTLDAARIFNPDKQIFLLGDDRNRWTKLLGISFEQYGDFEKGEEIEFFKKVYASPGDGKKEVLLGYFWFKRWFCIYNFARAKGFNRFWTFDSDNLILDTLVRHEWKFEHYDCTEQCNGICMNGLVNNLEVVKGYLDTINRLFQDKQYMQSLADAGSGNSEMLAYNEYRKNGSFRSIRLNTIIQGETFDDCICQSHDMEMGADGNTKNLTITQDGNIYTHHLPSDQLIRLVTINMSWVPTAAIAQLYFHSLKKLAYMPDGE